MSDDFSMGSTSASACALRRGARGVVAILVLAALQPAQAQVTPQRLLDAGAEPENWLMDQSTYNGHRFSALDDINAETIEGLHVVYSVPLGRAETSGNYSAARFSSPLVADGYLYTVDGWGRLHKIDLDRNAEAPDRIVWTAETAPENLDAWLIAAHGLALYQDSVIVTSGDGRVTWVNAQTGAIEREVQVADPTSGYGIAAAPLVVGDTLLVGGTAIRGGRGRLDALDAATGEALWHTSTIPAEGTPGADSWGENAVRMGGSLSQTGTYDPQSGLTIWGTGGPIPAFDTTVRPGANLHTNSAIAFDLADGEMAWSFQYSPGDGNGYSEAGSHLLIEGEEGLAVSHFSNNGFYYRLDALDGAFQSATPAVPGLSGQADNDVEGTQPRTTPPETAAQPTPESTPRSCPNILARAETLASYSPLAELTYGSAADACASQLVEPEDWVNPHAGTARARGLVTAIDPRSGSVVASRQLPAPVHAGLLSTAGRLVFTTTADGRLYALDDETLEPVWSHQFATLTTAPPITFSVDGRQYLAVLVGGNSFAADLPYPAPQTLSVQSLLTLAVLGLP